MAIRTIEAPGVEMHEIDKSQYTPSMTGSRALVTGFARSGEDYQPMTFTSRNAWLKYYGEPQTEAERYFYTACMEVLNQNGVLYCCKMPYSNESKDKFATFEYVLGSTAKSLTSDDAGPLSALSPGNGDETLSTYIEISSSEKPVLTDMAIIDAYRTGEARPTPDHIVIVDKTRRQYGKIAESIGRKGKSRELVGIIPIVTTAANAIAAQQLISVDVSSFTAFEPVNYITTLSASNSISNDSSGLELVSMRLNNLSAYEGDGQSRIYTLSERASDMFPQITMDMDGRFDREYLKKIGIVVVQAYIDPTENNKISFEVVESFCGSLDRTAKNPNGTVAFIDEIVNNTSEYINVFSNCEIDNIFNSADLLVLPFDQAKVASLGFYEEQCKDTINVSTSILKALDIALEKVSNIDDRDLDVVVDAGVSNIAQFIKTVASGEGEYDPTGITQDVGRWTCKSIDDTKMWKAVLQKLDNFCKNVRKDCMFVGDGPRPFCLQGQKKIVRPSKPENTIDANIIPFVKYLTGVNTSYGAGYCDWFEVVDEFSGGYFWCPPSIKACGAYIFTDLNFNYWDAPAGLTRGLVSALDVAFSPSNKQAGQIYGKSWNYAINYPVDGIVLEGQRTLQTKPSALDRVNVRRLMLRLERMTYKILKYVIYEGNTAYLRQRVVDLLDPYFKQAKIGGGLYDYRIICDETNNTAQTIDANELHISIGIKPTKTIEFIVVNFTLLGTNASWDEM